MEVECNWLHRQTKPMIVQVLSNRYDWRISFSKHRDKQCMAAQWTWPTTVHSVHWSCRHCTKKIKAVDHLSFCLLLLSTVPLRFLQASSSTEIDACSCSSPWLINAMLYGLASFNWKFWVTGNGISMLRDSWKWLRASNFGNGEHKLESPS